MLKKIIILLSLLLLLSSFVAAAPIDSSGKSHFQISLQVMEQSQLRNSTVAGLEGAVLMVSDESVALSLEQNLNNMGSENKLMIQSMRRVMVAQGESGVALVKGTAQAKLFTVVPLNREMLLLVSEDGFVARKSRPLDFLFEYEGRAGDIAVVTTI